MKQYDIDGEKYLIIINVTEFTNLPNREGTENDMSKIQNIFAEIYNVQLLGVLQGFVSKNDAKIKIKDLSDELKSMDPKLLVMIFMSHGKQYDMIHFSDSAIYLLKLIEPLLMNEKLASIPKLLLVQLCRGEDLNGTAIVDSAQSSKKYNLQEMIYIY